MKEKERRRGRGRQEEEEEEKKRWRSHLLFLSSLLGNGIFFFPFSFSYQISVGIHFPITISCGFFLNKAPRTPACLITVPTASSFSPPFLFLRIWTKISFRLSANHSFASTKTHLKYHIIYGFFSYHHSFHMRAFLVTYLMKSKNFAMYLIFFPL